MASKSLGRLRQWAGEVISSKEKPAVNEEFKELEKDIELRREGIQRLIVASGTYHHSLSKKKANASLDEVEKMLPIDILGITMIVHGEEFGDDSTFGSALVKLGRAHSKIATLQEAYALTFKDTFMGTLEKFKDQIKEYEAVKKKLENRKVIYDSATVKFEKAQSSRKDKDRREAEDELERARQRYDEAAEDLRAHMHAIQENEHNQYRELGTLLDLETTYIQSYLDVLKDVKADWPERSASKSSGSFNRDSQYPSRVNGQGRTYSSPSDSSEDDRPTTPGPISGRHSRAGSTASKPPSRPASRLSRKRASSSATTKGSSEDKDKEKEKDDNRPRRKSVTGWASSAVESVTGSKNKKSKDTDSFTTLDDDQHPGATENGTLHKSSSFRSLGRKSSKNKSKESLSGTTTATPKILKPPSAQGQKVVRALYDFSGSSDELSFKAGNDIIVVHEVLDDWWMGEVNGHRGLFPTSYTEVVGSNKSMFPPGKPPRVIHPGPGYDQDDSDFDGDYRHDHDHDHYMTSDADEEQIIRATPMAVNRSPIFYGGFDDKASFTGSMADEADDEDTKRIQPVSTRQRVAFPDDNGDDNWGPPKPPQQPQQPQTQQQQNSSTLPSFSTPSMLSQARRNMLRSLDPAQQPLINRSMSEAPSPTSGGLGGGGGSASNVYGSGSVSTGTTTPTKKIPPPPPPRRAISQVPATGPPIPERKAPGAAASHTLNGSASTLTTPASSVSGHGYDRSPFESAIELEGVGGAAQCEQFRQNPFKPKGMCSNCLEFHG
uniref:BAR-domain-containing protein n=1 Tax=Psilocybe cubensis TaxID=181762 RepID=A0A8H7XKR2_PSICU